MTRLYLTLLAATALLLSWTGAVEAHAFLRHAVPLVGSTIPSSPPTLTLDYTEAVEPRFCTVEVQNAQGQRVDKNDLHTAPDDGKRLLIGLPTLPPGTYKVVWHVTSVDTHRTDGSFSFTVEP